MILPENFMFLLIGSHVAGPKSRKPGTKRIGRPRKFPDRERASSNSDCDSISQTSR